jgi:hypothetical protein
MHTVFFGGIAQYRDSAGVLVQDNNVPFVKTIARVTRNGSGGMAELKLPVEMPAYLGSGSEFLVREELPQYKNGVLKLDSFTADTTLAGYIYGGISSTAANIFFTNTGTQSTAWNGIFKVYVIKGSPDGVHEVNTQSTGSLQMQLYPSPAKGDFSVKFHMSKASPVTITIINSSGAILYKELIANAPLGVNTFRGLIKNQPESGIYFITVETNYEKATQKIVVTP